MIWFKDKEKATMQLWIAFDPNDKEIKCVTVTEIRQYPKYKVCDCKITTGTSYKAWVDFMDNVVNWARSLGCKKMELFTRPGWERVLKPKGFIKTQVQLEKVLWKYIHQAYKLLRKASIRQSIDDYRSIAIATMSAGHGNQ